MGLTQVRLLSGIVVVALILLFVFDVIGFAAFIVLIVVEAVVTAGMSFWILRGQRDQHRAVGHAARSCRPRVIARVLNHLPN